MRTSLKLLTKFGGQTYAQFDDFLTDAAATLPASANAEPGPGLRKRSADSAGRTSVTLGNLLTNGAVASAFADPAFHWTDSAGNFFARQAGRAAVFKIVTPTTISPTSLYGWTSNATVGLGTVWALYYQSGNGLFMTRAGNAAQVGTINPVTTYWLVMPPRSNGQYLYIYGGEYDEWTLLQVESSFTTTPLAPAHTVNGTGKHWLSTVQVRDFPTLVDSELLLVNVTSSIADGTTFTGAADSIIHATIQSPNPLANSAEIRYRVVDANNYWFVRATSGGALQAGRVESGVETLGVDLASQIAIATTYTIEVQAIGNVHRVYLRTGTFQSVLKGTITQTTAMDSATGMRVNRSSYLVNALRVWPVNSTKYNVLPSGNIIPFLPFGDSKSASGVEWPVYLLAQQADIAMCREYPTRIATAGFTTQDAKDDVDTNLAAATGTPTYILYNLGANDVSDWAAQEPAIVTNMRYIWDAMHTQWPNAHIYVMRVWVRDYETQCDEYAARVVTAMSGRESYVHLGPDERIFLEGGDDGATYTSDGIHPNDAGNRLTARQWLNVLGL